MEMDVFSFCYVPATSVDKECKNNAIFTNSVIRALWFACLQAASLFAHSFPPLQSQSSRQ